MTSIQDHTHTVEVKTCQTLSRMMSLTLVTDIDKASQGCWQVPFCGISSCTDNIYP